MKRLSYLLLFVLLAGMASAQTAKYVFYLKYIIFVRLIF